MTLIALVRTLGLVIGLVPLTIFLSLFMVICFFLNFPKGIHWLTQLWCDFVLKTQGIRVSYSGLEKIKNLHGGAVMIFNHTSLFDIPALQKTPVDHQICFGAKSELFQIPFFSLALKMMGVLPIVRGDRKQVLSLYEKQLNKLQQKILFTLAPEGTRGENPHFVNEFKSGPFIFAIQAQVPIICAFIKGAHEVLPKGHFIINKKSFFSKIEIEFKEILSTQDYTLEKRKDLQLIAQKIYEDHLSK